MRLFEAVKENVTVRQAAELYGYKPNRSGMIRCIFHNDRSPSMKVDRRYYCFGCGCTGDAVDFTAQLFGLGAKEAAQKLADDFGILYDSRARASPVRKGKPLPQKKMQNEEDKKEKEYLRCLRAYLDYNVLLRDWKIRYAPGAAEEEWDGRFVKALKEQSIVEYYLDILLFGEEWDKQELIREKREEVEKIEQICRKEYGQGKRECHIPHGTDGGHRCRPKHQGASGGDTKRGSQRDDAELHDCPSGRPTACREPEI